MRILDRIKGVVQKMAANTGTAHEFKDIFELGGVPAFNEFYNFGIFPWKYVYRGFYNAWHLVNAPTIANPKAKRKLFHLNMAKAACAELAGLIWSEQCKVNVTLDGFEPTEQDPDGKAQRFIEKVLDANAFGVKMQESVEQMLALGGLALKVWYEPKRDEEGKPIEGEGKIRLGYAMADQFVPTAWDNAKVTEGVFISRQAKDGYYYTRLEWHKWNGETYVITNDLYRSEQRREGTRETQDILGYRYPLAALYPFLDEETTINSLQDSLFAYARTPVANNLDDNSPLGMSIYGNAMETLHALDICYDSFVREFQLGKKRIIVPARCIRTVVDPETGVTRRYFDANDETYEALSTDDPQDLKIQDNSVELRVEEHVAAINAHLAILCLQLGFSASTFSFDQHTGIKTATEVVSENSKTYKTIKSCQQMLTPAIERLVKGIFAVAALYDVEFEGEKVAGWFKATEPICDQYECSVMWDDSVIEDKTAQLNRALLLLSNGLTSKKTIMTTLLGMTDEQAYAELAEIAQESPVGAIDFDRLNTFD